MPAPSRKMPHSAAPSHSKGSAVREDSGRLPTPASAAVVTAHPAATSDTGERSSGARSTSSKAMNPVRPPGCRALLPAAGSLGSVLASAVSGELARIRRRSRSR